jgi:TusA-related sulfurtransferase
MSIYRLEGDAYRLDTRGWMCPYPKYMVSKLLSQLKGVKSVEVLVDCPSAVDDVPAVALKDGFKTVSVDLLRDGEWRILLKKE